MSANLAADARLADFTRYVANTAWTLLDGQGYDMQDKGVGRLAVMRLGWKVHVETVSSHQ